MISFRRGCLLLALLFIVTMTWLRPLDAPAAAQVDTGLKRALAMYATARVIHGVVSVAQGVDISFNPLGMGASMTPGSRLTPVAELLKQFSDVMLLVCVSFGIQKMLLAMGGALGVSIGVTIAALAVAWFAARRAAVPLWLARLCVVLLLVRFAVPLATVGSEALFHAFLAKDYDISHQAISQTTNHAADAVDAEQKEIAAAGETKSWFDRVKERVRRPVGDASTKYESLKMSLNQAAEHIISLIGIFVLQTLLFPLFMLAVFYGLAMAALRAPLAQRTT